MSAMAGPWIFPQDNSAYFQEVEFLKGQLVECQLYDDDGAPQGHGLWDTGEQLEKRREGIWTRARLIAVSDPHLKWWLDKGPGTKLQKTKDARIGVPYRLLQMPAGALTEKKLVWFKDELAKADVQAEISRLVGQQARKAGELKGGQGQPLAFSESEVDPGEGALAITPPEGEEVGDRLKRLRREVGKAKEGKKKKDKSEGSGKRRPRKKERGSPTAAAKQPLWFGQKKQAEQRDSSESSADSFGSSGDRREAMHDKKEKKEHKRARGKRKWDKKADDRGPFGAGAKVKFARSDATSISSGEDDETGQSFQAAPLRKVPADSAAGVRREAPRTTSKSPLDEDEGPLLALEEGALNPLSEPNNITPSTATSYFLTVMLPLHRERLNLRVQREMRTVAKSLDQIAMGEAQRAAGILAQRLMQSVGTLELLVDDQSWGRAAHIELLPAEGAALMEPDESWVATREHVFEGKA